MTQSLYQRFGRLSRADEFSAHAGASVEDNLRYIEKELGAQTDAFLDAYGFVGTPDEVRFFEAIYALM